MTTSNNPDEIRADILTLAEETEGLLDGLLQGGATA